MEASKSISSFHSSAHLLKHVDENFLPSCRYSLRQISSSQVLQWLARERSWLAAMEVTKAIVIHLERKQLLIATEEVSWLEIPLSTIGIYHLNFRAKSYQILIFMKNRNFYSDNDFLT